MKHYTEQTIIEDLQTKYNFKNYLEIGKGHAGNSWRGSSKFIIRESIDIIESYNPTYLGSSDSFFESNKTYFDLIFIDGNHNIEQVLIDTKNSLNFLSNEGVIVYHDTNPMNYNECFIGDNLRNEKSQSDAYKIIPILIKDFDYYFFHVMGNSGGFTVLKKNKKKIITYFEELELILSDNPKISWDSWEKNKKNILNIKNSIDDE